MSAAQIYVWFPGNAAEALTWYESIFGGGVRMFTYAEFSRTDGPADAIAHGELQGPVALGGADAAPGEETISMQGVSITLLGTADAATLTRWFNALAEDGTVIDPLTQRPWGGADGQLRDRYGVRWLIGYEPEA